MRSKRLVPALTAGALLLAACGTGSDGTSAPITAADAPASEAATPDVEPATSTSAPATDGAGAAEEADGEEAGEEADGQPDDDPAVAAPAALQFSAPLVGGGELDASSLAGKPTVFWFWAPT